MIQPRTILSVLGGILLLVAVSYVSVHVDRHLRGGKVAKTDTVRVSRKVPHIVRDTVVKRVPDTRIEYKTIRDTVVKRVPVPTDFRLKGALPQNYFQIEENQAKVTYFDTQNLRYATDVYNIKPLDNKVSLGLSGFGTSRHITVFPYLEYSTSRLELRAGYGPTVTQNGYTLTPSLQVSFDLLRYRWR